jgi:integrase
MNADILNNGPAVASSVHLVYSALHTTCMVDELIFSPGKRTKVINRSFKQDLQCPDGSVLVNVKQVKVLPGVFIHPLASYSVSSIAGQGALYSLLINGDRGGYLSYSIWRKYLQLAQGYTAADPDGIVSYTAHELRHVCASLLIASGASDMQVAHQMGHSKIETTKNIYGHLFAQDRTFILDAMNQAVSRLRVYESQEPQTTGGGHAVA